MINGFILTSVLKAYSQIHTWEVWMWTQEFTSNFVLLLSCTLPFHDLPSTFSSLGLHCPFSIQKSRTSFVILCQMLPTTMPAGRRATRRWRGRTWWKFVPSSWGHCSSEWIRRFPFLGILGTYTFLLSPWSQPLPWDDLGIGTQENRGEKNDFSLLWALSYSVSPS